MATLTRTTRNRWHNLHPVAYAARLAKEVSFVRAIPNDVASAILSPDLQDIGRPVHIGKLFRNGDFAGATWGEWLTRFPFSESAC